MEIYDQVATVNPYAVAEQVAGKRISWETLDAPGETLSHILHVPTRAIFTADSPLLTPDYVRMQDGHSVLLDQQAARERLREYMNKQPFAAPCAAEPGMLPERSVLDVLFPTESVFLAPFALPPQFVTEPRACAAPQTDEWCPPGHEYQDGGEYFTDAPEMTDPCQGGLGDCYFISAMSSVSWSRPYAINNMVRSCADTGLLQHRVSFFDTAAKRWDHLEVDETVPLQAQTGQWLYARSNDPGEIWPGVMEKAYAIWRTGARQHPDFRKISGGNPIKACAELIGGEMQTLYLAGSPAEEAMALLRQHCARLRYHDGVTMGGKTFNPMTAWTGPYPPDDCSEIGLVVYHAYSILGMTFANGCHYVVLRNPWGCHVPTRHVLTGRWYYNTDGASLELGKNGVFAMELEAFRRYFYAMGAAL